MDLKINNLEMNTVQDINNKKTNQDSEPFKFTLISKIEEKELKNKLNGLLTDIKEQGDKISKHMDIKDMKRYRELVKTFMNEVVTRSHKFTR